MKDLAYSFMVVSVQDKILLYWTFQVGCKRAMGNTLK